MVKWRKLLYFVPLIFIVCLVFVLNLFFVINREEKTEFENLPRIELYSDGLTIEQIYKNGKTETYDATVYFPDDGLYQEIELKGRGNSTFRPDKMPFQIKFTKKTDLFGMGKAKKWILLANYYDSTEIRNAVAFYLERLLGETYALNGKYVELYFNGENHGLYYLTPKIEIAKNRVDLRDSLGVIAEFDTYHNANKLCFKTETGGCLTISDSVSKDNQDRAMEGLIKTYDAAVMAAKSGDYPKVSKLIDIESFAIYYLLSEFTVDPDAYATSFYLYKDGDNDELHAGPGWDYDYAFGNRRWRAAIEEDFFSPNNKQFQRHWVFDRFEYYDQASNSIKTNIPHDLFSKLLYYLIDMPEFLSEVKIIYRDRMMGKGEEIISFIKSISSELKDYCLYDNSRLDFNDYFSELFALIDWINLRFEHFDKEYGGL